MSIDISVRPKRYSLEELRELFNRYSTVARDFEEWLSAMQITRQLEKKGKQYIPTKLGEEKTPAKPQDKIFQAVLAGGLSDAKYPRFGIKTLVSEGTRVDPTKMKLMQYMDAKGNWVDVPEQPELSIQKPRSKYEKWRAEVVGLPIDIRRKYPVKIAKSGKEGTLLKVKIEGTISHYFSVLRLWGYNVESMISFGVTAAGDNPRDLELHGWQFPYETKGTIGDEINIIGKKTLAVMPKWLEAVDIEYYNLFDKCNDAGTTDPVPGTSYDPLIEAPSTKAMVELFDHKAKTVSKTRYKASASLPRKWYNMDDSAIAALFSLTSDNVDGARGYHGRGRKGSPYDKLRKGQVTLDEVLKKGKEGEGFKK
ncbi:MAG: hypothetical protein NTW30_06235 [Candidatus Aenigmarchaeota archaeon]|nr:hypothetical protein [Candidatus Aenigmarchaeota archaeon]